MLSQQIRNSALGSSSLLEILDAVLNWRAVALLLATFVATLLVAALGGSLATTSAVLALVFVLIAAGVMFYGFNAVGMMMMDEARGQPSRPIGAAAMSSLATSHRLILALLAIGAIYLVGIIAFALLLFVCRIPGIGPLLYALVFPAGIVIAGIAILAIPTIVFPLAAPAIWSGATTMAAVSHLMVVSRKRLPLVLVLMLIVGLVASMVGGLVGAIVMGGTWYTAILSAGILGPSVGGLSGIGTGLVGSLMGGGSGSGAGGYVVAAMLGGGAVWAAAATLPGLVYLRGASAVYLRAIEGLDLATEQAALREKMAAAQARAREFQAQAQATAQQYAQKPRPVASVSVAGGVAATAPAAAACPSCGTTIVPGDLFCANCGHKLA